MDDVGDDSGADDMGDSRPKPNMDRNSSSNSLDMTNNMVCSRNMDTSKDPNPVGGISSAY